MRAISSFTVTAQGVRLRVRVMPTGRDVDAMFRDSSRPRRDGLIVPAFFQPSGVYAKHDGTIVLAADADLVELVPHEVAHAVVDKLNGVHIADDERAATAIGLLTSRIHSRLRKAGLL